MPVTATTCCKNHVGCVVFPIHLDLIACFTVSTLRVKQFTLFILFRNNKAGKKREVDNGHKHLIDILRWCAFKRITHSTELFGREYHPYELAAQSLARYKTIWISRFTILIKVFRILMFNLNFQRVSFLVCSTVNAIVNVPVAIKLKCSYYYSLGAVL